MPRPRLTPEQAAASRERRRQLKRERNRKKRVAKATAEASLLAAAESSPVLSYEMWDAVVTRWNEATKEERAVALVVCKAKGHLVSTTPTGLRICPRCCGYS